MSPGEGGGVLWVVWAAALAWGLARWRRPPTAGCGAGCGAARAQGPRP